MNSDGKLDPQYAGRYVITKIRHRVTNDEYIQVLECSKDSVFTAYSSDGETSYQAHKLPREFSIAQELKEFEGSFSGQR